MINVQRQRKSINVHSNSSVKCPTCFPCAPALKHPKIKLSNILLIWKKFNTRGILLRVCRIMGVGNPVIFVGLTSSCNFQVQSFSNTLIKLIPFSMNMCLIFELQGFCFLGTIMITTGRKPSGRSKIQSRDRIFS